MMTNAIQKTDTVEQLPVSPETQASNALNALMASIESGKLAPESLSAVLDAQERILDRQAEMEFNRAMVACQKDMPQILKTDFNEQTETKFETLDNLNKIISPVYTAHGFAVSFGTGRPSAEGMLNITAEVIHQAGHSKIYQYELPIDDKGIKGTKNKTAVHGSASTVTYGRRYLLKMIFNLTTADDTDYDGNPVAMPSIDDEQVAHLEDLIMKSGTDPASFCKFFKISNIHDLKVQAFDDAERMLNQRIKAKEKQNAGN